MSESSLLAVVENVVTGEEIIIVEAARKDVA